MALPKTVKKKKKGNAQVEKHLRGKQLTGWRLEVEETQARRGGQAVGRSGKAPMASVPPCQFGKGIKKFLSNYFFVKMTNQASDGDAS